MTEPTLQTRRRRTRAFDLYKSVLEESDAGLLAAAAHAEGLADEVALVRVLLHRHLAEHPEGLELTIKGMHLLVRMVAAQHKLSGADAAALDARADELARHFAAAILGEEAPHG
jgi:hypothetical protein